MTCNHYFFDLFHVSPGILRLFFQSTILSVLLFNRLCYHSSARKDDMDCMEKIISRAKGIIGEELGSLDASYADPAVRKMNQLRLNCHHPLHSALSACEPVCAFSQRLKCVRARTNRLRNSSLPNAVRTYSSTVPRCRVPDVM